MFYDQLKSVCTAHGTTVTAVAKAIGISTSIPNAWKKGRIPRMDTVQQIAEYLGVPLSALLDESSPSEQTSTNAMTTAIYKESLSLTAEETTIIKAFRSNPSFAQIVRSTMDALGINHEEKDVVS